MHSTVSRIWLQVGISIGADRDLLRRQFRAFEQSARAIFPWDHEAVLFHTQLTVTGWASASDHTSVAGSPGCTGAAKYVLSDNSAAACSPDCICNATLTTGP